MILYLRRIYAHFHLASYTIPDTVDVPRQVGSLVPTVRESASTFSLDPKVFFSTLFPAPQREFRIVGAEKRQDPLHGSSFSSIWGDFDLVPAKF